jgi:EmrB/QacA subfamily drug resistance transporter
MQRKWRVLIIVCVGVFMSSLDLFIVNIAFPAIRTDFAGTDLATLSWVLSAYAIVYAALMVPAGRWADAVGRKRAYLGGLGLFVAASAVCAAAPSVGVLVAARVVQAAGAALMLPTSLGLLLPEFPASERARAVAIWAAVGGAAAATGPTVGGLLVEADWRWIFLVNVPIGLAALVAGTRHLGEIRDPSTLRPDVLGAGLLTAGIGALVVAIVKGEDWGWGSPAVAGALAGAAVLLALTAWRCARHPAPIVEPAMVRVRSFSAAVAASLLFFAGFAAMLLGSVLFLTGVWHEPVLQTGLMIAPGPVMAATFSLPAARLGARIGQRATGVLGMTLFAAGGAWWLVELSAQRAYLGDFLPGMLIGGIGVGFVIPTLTGAATATLAPERLSTGAAIVTMGRQVGSALGVAALVAVLGAAASPADFDHGWTLMIAAAVAAGVVFGALGPGRVPAREPEPARALAGVTA